MPRIKADSIEKRQDEFLRCYVEKDGRMAHACLLSNVTPAQVKGWVERDPVFEEKFDDARHLVKDNFREVIDNGAIRDQDRTLMRMKAEADLEEYSKRREVVHSGQINHAHAHIALENLSAEERDRILAEGARLIESGEV